MLVYLSGGYARISWGKNVGYYTISSQIILYSSAYTITAAALHLH
jgi:hypothetical protein